jgi:hypothetical protein
MPLGQGESSSGNVDGATTIRRRARFSRRPVERINPGNVEFVSAMLGCILCYIKHAIYGLLSCWINLFCVFIH